MYSYYIKAIN